MKKAATKNLDIIFNDQNILEIRVKEKARLEYEEVKKSIELGLGLINGKKVPVMVDLRNIEYFSVEARKYLRSDEGVIRGSIATAVVIDSSLSRIVGNFFIGLKKIGIPERLFSSEEKALSWLGGIKNG